jgi:AraC-like DNA-binding protein
MNNIVLSTTQVFQLAAIGPCLFIAAILLFSKKHFRLTLLPGLYFLSLASSFIVPLIGTLADVESGSRVFGIFLLMESMLPELSFLLILQFVSGQRPQGPAWLVLLIPLIGSYFILHALDAQDVCMTSGLCYGATYLLKLYRIFSASLVFMLLTIFLSRKRTAISIEDPTKRAKYWLIMALILFNLLQLAVDLAAMAGKIPEARGQFIHTMVSVTFVYLVLSSIFRVFSHSFGLRPIHISRSIFTMKDQEIIDKVERLVRDTKPYRKIGFKRRTLADMVGVKEHQLSKAINQKYGKSFSELMNDFRIEEAKMLLAEKKDPITAVSYDTGFSSIASFNRVFKKYTGLSPSAYRQKKKKEMGKLPEGPTSSL